MTKKQILILTLVGISFLSNLSSLFAQSSEWSESKRKKGIQVLTRPFPGSNLDEFLGRTEVDASIAQVITLLTDPASCKNLYHQCKELTVLSGTEKKSVVYLRNGAPWPVNDRDLIMDRSFEQNDKTLATVMKIKRLDSNARPTPSGVTRMENFEGVWRIIPQTNGKLKIEYQAHFEPGGSVPQSVINLVLTDTPYESLLNLKTLVEEGKHKDAKFDWIKEPTKN
ncbi:START domain-containing protein [Leptospira sp. 2 VSF19]|uniref:START domain-containing protein n=1 Tax=Leptospira soteropolitanensis TaxID=2950025 RepID=A0AAW5VJ70_9LEPT|nr:START domain-containing protein [Leptospira soteropolitanensis]MCW7491391.1 START domain-containing protein [Leptospira soteropolitanensis]MCW7498976.1 START domain-containing protein [Leptospira soteropolitanensis]MCW7521432.1 START domain-containing protein [Leptospira soteropolitanensis]MCW7525079.1 START domain-containing protein [Leptospira soteropolitanensis]MCW7528947.1 START domain-containing protein [Leptospira soteropolitanensis]